MNTSQLLRSTACMIAVATYSFGAPASSQVATTLALGGNRLQQVAITTSDLPRAIAFYRDKLGLRLLFESNGMAFFDLAGTRLMIALDRTRVRGRPTGIIYIDAPKFDATVLRMKAMNMTLEGGTETVQAGVDGDLNIQQFVDPDGNALSVMGFVPKH